VPDLGQVPQPGPGIVAPGLVPVLAVLGGQGVDRDDQAGPGAREAQPPGAVSAGRPAPAGRGEAEPVLARRRAGARALAVAAGFGAGAAVPDGVAVLVGDRDAPGGPGVTGGGGGQVAGQPRVDRAQAGEFAGPVRQAGRGVQRDGQGDLAGEPACRAAGRSSVRGGTCAGSVILAGGVGGLGSRGQESLPSSKSR